MFDAHAHLTELPPDPEPSGVTGWIVPGVDHDSWMTGVRLAADPRVRAAVGLHPWHVPDTLQDLWLELGKLRMLLPGSFGMPVSEGRPCAIGETGLDKGWRGGPMEVQRGAFHAQVVLASEQELPLIIHCVRAHGGCLEILKEPGFVGGGMVHDFGGPMEMIGPWVEAGFYLSISPRGMGHAKVVAAIPEERLLVETDDEGVDRLSEVIAAVAEHRGASPEAVAAVTESNARRLFGLL